MEQGNTVQRLEEISKAVDWMNEVNDAYISYLNQKVEILHTQKTGLFKLYKAYTSTVEEFMEKTDNQLLELEQLYRTKTAKYQKPQS
jgi:uncharacterized protein YbaP (TraB family)